jgi:hypothetical protein
MRKSLLALAFFAAPFMVSAQNSYTVTITSDPVPDGTYEGHPSVQASVGSTVIFHHDVQGSGAPIQSVAWVSDGSKLDCAGYPNTYSTDISCIVKAEGASFVHCSVTPEGSNTSFISNDIYVSTPDPLRCTITPTVQRDTIRFDINGTGGSQGAYCHFDGTSYHTVSGSPRLIEMTEFSLTYDATKPGRIRIVAKPTGDTMDYTIEAMEICSETDQGLDYPNKGTTTGKNNWDGSSGSYTDSCSDSTLTEYWCVNGLVGGSHTTCQNGCDNGVCKSSSGQSSSDWLPQGYCCVPNDSTYPQCSVLVSRASCESRGGTLSEWKNTGACASCRASSAPSTHIPPAGYEDEVLVNYSAYANPFPDTNLNNLSGKAAAELYRRAVIGGFPDGEFKGSRSVNRAEAAKFLLLARRGSVAEIANSGRFPDVLDGQWYTKYVVTAAQQGIISGYPDGFFRPADQVNTAEFLKMLSLTFGLSLNLSYGYDDVPSGSWFAPYAGIAERYDLFPYRASSLFPERALSREEVAIAIYQYLSNRQLDSGLSLSQARDAQRRSGVNTVLNAIYQYTIDEGFALVDSLPEVDARVICARNPCEDDIGKSGVDMSRLLGTYLVALPLDPSLPSTNDDTGYAVVRSGRKITVSAPLTEAGTMIAVTR